MNVCYRSEVLVKDNEYVKPDEMVSDRIVCGSKIPKVREKLINQGSELTLEKIIEIARLFEMSRAKLKTMSVDNDDKKFHAKNSSTKDKQKYASHV